MRALFNTIAFVVFCLLAVGSALGQEATISFIEVEAPKGATALGMRAQHPECRALSIPVYLEQFAELNGIENSEDGFRHIWPGEWMLPAVPSETATVEIETVTLMVTPDATTQVLSEDAPPVEVVETASEATAIVVAEVKREKVEALEPADTVRRELALPDRPDYDKLYLEVVGSAHTRTHILVDKLNQPAETSDPQRLGQAETDSGLKTLAHKIDEFESLRLEVDSLRAALLARDAEIERLTKSNAELKENLAEAETTKMASTKLTPPIVIESQSSAPTGSSWPWIAALCITVATAIYLYRDRRKQKKRVSELDDRNALMAYDLHSLDQDMTKTEKKVGELKERLVMFEDDIVKHRLHFYLPGMKPEILRLPIKKIEENGTVWVKLPEYQELIPEVMIENALRHLDPKVLQNRGIILPPTNKELPARRKLVLDFLKNPTSEPASAAV